MIHGSRPDRAINLRCLRAKRRDLWQTGPCVALIALATLMGAAVWHAQATGRTGPPCLFKTATTVPCLTCGTTRATLALSRGDAAGAFAFNPLTTLLMTALAGWALLRIGFARRLEVRLSPRARCWAWAAAAAACLLNWVYVVRFVG